MVLFIKKYRFLFAVLCFAALLMTVIFLLFSIDSSTNRMITEYLTKLGWEVESTPSEISYLTVPEAFDSVYTAYNAVQISSGFDLAPLKGKSLSRYTYRVLNHKRSHETEVIANVFVYENRIVAGDICSAAPGGFMHGLNAVENISDSSPSTAR